MKCRAMRIRFDKVDGFIIFYYLDNVVTFIKSVLIKIKIITAIIYS